jgi:hypothetical protein
MQRNEWLTLSQTGEAVMADPSMSQIASESRRSEDGLKKFRARLTEGDLHCLCPSQL